MPLHLGTQLSTATAGFVLPYVVSAVVLTVIICVVGGYWESIR